MDKKEKLRNKLEELKSIGITTVDDLITILEFLPLGEEVDSHKEQTDISLEAKIKKLLHRLGTPAHIKGYQYVTDAITIAVEDVETLDAITKVLYPSVAKMHKTTGSRVERAIRHAVEVTWDRGDLDILQEVFGYTININKGKPTNGEFISLIADYIRMGGE